MKYILLLSVMLFSPFAVVAQTNATPSESFFQQVGSWLTEFDTNRDFNVGKFNLSAGVDTVNNDLTAASLLLEFKLGNWPLWLENDMRNTVALGKVLSDQVGLNYSVVKYDTKVSGYLDLGRRFDTDQTYIEPGVRIKKMLGPLTYAGTSLGWPVYLNRGTGSKGLESVNISVFTGFIF